MNFFCTIFPLTFLLITCSEGFLPWGGGGGGYGNSFGINDLLQLLGQGGHGPQISFRPQANLGSTLDLLNDESNVGRGEPQLAVRGAEGEFASTALAETNMYRAKHGAGPLTLDPQLSAGCQSWAEQLAQSGQMKHSCSMCSEYGENLWMMGGKILNPSEAVKQAVKSWYDEVKMYNWNNPTFSSNTGHFTALVWKGSTKMGIGLATNPGTKRTYVVARYVPAGNMEGAFKENVGPSQ